MAQSYYIIQSGKDARVETTFVPSLELDRCYEIALQSLETYYSFPNIDKGNNKIRISLDNGTVWKDLVFSVGCYEHDDINNELQRMIVAVGGKQKDIILKANKNTFQTIMILTEKVQVDFKIENSIRSVLGFDSNLYKKGRHASEHKVDIMRVNSIFVHTDVIGSTYVNGSQTPVIYSFFPNTPPGGKIIVQPSVLIYLPVSLSVISRLTSWLTDQDNRPLNLREEELTIKYHLRCIDR